VLDGLQQTLQQGVEAKAEVMDGARVVAVAVVRAEREKEVGTLNR
jgi:hypothetical protein